MKTLTDKIEIRKAICAPPTYPDSIVPDKLEPIGKAKYKGDSLPSNWSCDSHFDIGMEYPVYDYKYNEGDPFVIGKEGKGLKMLPKAWGKIVAL